MPAPIERLFYLRPIDQASTLWYPRFDSQIDAAASASMTVDIAAIPADQLFWITRWALVISPGGTQTYTNVALSVTDIAGNFLANLYNNNQAGAAGVSLEAQDTIDLCLIGGVHSLRATVAFSAGVSSNGVTVNALGYGTPRGNVAVG